ncbi:ribonuclease H [Sesbania bispinosa]|nr:ribonuclease H [Sesbania bispinosa]
MGDRNTKFFHLQTVIRRKKNKAHGLFLENGSWCEDNEQLGNEANRFFHNLFGHPPNDSELPL